MGRFAPHSFLQQTAAVSGIDCACFGAVCHVTQGSPTPPTRLEFQFACKYIYGCDGMKIETALYRGGSTASGYLLSGKEIYQDQG